MLLVNVSGKGCKGWTVNFMFSMFFVAKGQNWTQKSPERLSSQPLWDFICMEVFPSFQKHSVGVGGASSANSSAGR